MDFSIILLVICAVLALVLLFVFLRFGRSQASFKLDIGGAAPKASGGNDKSSETHVNKRILGLGIGIGGVFSLIIARLWSMQLVNSDYWKQQAESNRTRTVTTLAPRGRILDRNGQELVGNRPSLTVVASSDLLQDEIELQLLANLIGMPKQAVRRKIQDTSEGAQSMRTVSIDVSRRIVSFLYAHPTFFPGVEIEQRTQRSYPNGGLAAHVVGYTGTVTEEQLKKQKTDESGLKYQSGDVVGQSGIEYQYESVLQGIRGETQVYVDASGEVLDVKNSIDALSGSDIRLTIDVNTQKLVEDTLDKYIERAKAKKYDATEASCVVMDCTNGEILAMASRPNFTPSTFVGGIASSDWENLTNEDSNYPLLNRAIAGLFPSGSVIKALTTFAGLDNNIATAQSSWVCTGWWTGFGEAYGMECWLKTGHGTVNLVRAITVSCDIAFYEIGKGFFYAENGEGLQQKYREYGFGSLTGIDLPGEQEGRVPDAEWKWNYFVNSPDDARRWQGGDNCNIAIGQGDFLCTLIQLVGVYCAIANQSGIWRPHLLKSVMAAAGEGTVVDYKPEMTKEISEPEANRNLVYSGLQGVCYESSVSANKLWSQVPVRCAGKTGTAEMTDGLPIGWFVGFFPFDDPKYVIAANINRVKSGELDVMPIVANIASHLFGGEDIKV